MLNFLFTTGSNNYPQVFLEECYRVFFDVVIEKNISKYIIDDIETSDSDRENADKENSNEENYRKIFFYKIFLYM